MPNQVVTLGPGYNDGAANAPAGTPELPNLLSGYAVRPPWQVAGVDYAVGIPSGTVLKDPLTINMAGVSVNSNTHIISVTGNNITLNGYDFSLEGGWEISVSGSNAVIENSNFKIGANNLPPIDATSQSLNLTIKDNIIDGNGKAPTPGALITNANLIEYNWIKNAGQDVVDYGMPLVEEYNLIQDGGEVINSHSDFVQIGTGNYNNTVEFNTFYQDGSVPMSTQGVMYEPNNPATVQGTIAYNTGVLLSGANVNYFTGVNPSFVVSPGVTIHDNYVDLTGTNGGFTRPYTSSSLVRYYNNYDMKSSKLISEPGNTEIAPVTVTKVVASPASGQESPGNTIALTLTMSSPVTVSGTPTLGLNDGGTATYIGGSGTNALAFSYTISAGDSAVSALAITGVNGPNGATINDANGNAANLAGALTTFPGLQIESGLSVPMLSSIAESPSTGDLEAGKTVTLTLNMSSSVTVSGTPTLTLNDGGVATYTGGSGTTALTFSYAVAAGQNTASLGITAVNLPSGATIKNASGNSAVLTLTGLTQIGPMIDTTPPAAPVIIGDTVNANIVTLTGTAEANSTIKVFDGSTALGTATTSGSGAWTFATGMLAAGAHSFTATATDAAGNTGPASAAYSQSIAVAPTITSITETPSTGDLEAGKTVTLTLNMSSSVTVSGTPTLMLNDGGVATYTGGSGTTALTFSYAVVAGQNTASLGITAVNLPSGATIKNASGNNAVLTVTGLTQIGPMIDTTPPAAPVITGDTVNANIVTLTGTAEANSTITVFDGSTTLGTATTNGSGAWTFGTRALAVGTHSFTATATDAAGNTGAVSAAFSQSIAAAPVVTSIVETPSSGDLSSGKTVTLTLNMSGAVTVSGTPTLTLNDGGVATYTGGSGTTALTFSYAVAAGQNTASLAATAVNLNGATVKDLAGNSATLSVTGLTQIGPQIDTLALTPAVTKVLVSPTSGTEYVGTTLTLTLNLNEAVTVAGGIPTLTLNDGGTATYVGGSGTDTLTFHYTVGSGDKSVSALAINQINLNGASVQDGAGNLANLAGAMTTLTGVQIDTTTPAVTQVLVSPANADDAVGKTIVFTLAMSKVVKVAGTPTLALNDGGTAIYTGGSGTNALTFSYTVGANDTSVEALAITSVNLPNGGAIFAGKSNARGWRPHIINANLSGALTTFSGLQVDTTTPTVTQVISSPASGTAMPGDTINLLLELNEAVKVSGTPVLLLNDGGAATYASGSGTNVLTFSYTVGIHDTTVPTLAITQIDLPNGATVRNGAGTNANLAGAVTSVTGLAVDPPVATPTVTQVMTSAGSDLHINATIPTLPLKEASAPPVKRVTDPPAVSTIAINDGNQLELSGPSLGSNNSIGSLMANDTNAALLRQYMAASFAHLSDGHGGTAISELVQNQQQQYLSHPHT